MSKDEAWSIDLHPFDASTINLESKIVVVGQSGSGKTALMQYILYCLKDQLDVCVVFCPTRETRVEYERFIQKCFVYPEWDVTHLQRIIDAQIMMSRRKGPKDKDGNPTQAPLKHVGIIIDDCLYEKKDFSHPALNYLLMNGRHEKFFTMIGAQYIVDLPKNLRSQINLVFVFPESMETNRDALRKHILGCFSTDKQLSATFDKLERYEALVLDIKAARMRTQSLFYCKALYPLPRFRIGDTKLWEEYYRFLVKKNYNNVDDFIKDKLHRARSGAVAAEEAMSVKKGKGKGGGAGGGVAGAGGIEIRRHVATGNGVTTTTPAKTKRTPKVKPLPLPRLAPIIVPTKKTPKRTA
jgi:energy-coupling factor transporter ATP-binding protein EcfA2